MISSAVVERSSAVLRVIEIDPLTDPRWEELVNEHPDALVYHHPNWLRVLGFEAGPKATGLACVDEDGCLRGVLPLMQTSGVPLLRGSLRAGRRLSSLPRTPVAGPLAYDEEARRALLAAAVSRARSQRDTRLEIKAMACDLDQGVEGLTRVPSFTSYVLDLPERPEELRFGNSRHNSEIRRNLRRADEYGVRVRDARSLDDLRQWYWLHAEMMQEKRVPPRPLSFFEAIWHYLRPAGMMRLLLAEQHEESQTRLIGGALSLRHGQKELGFVMGRRRADRSLHSTYALIWQMLHDSCAAGYRYYDMGEVSDGDTGLAQFKAKWGGRPVRWWRYYAPGPSERDKPQSDPGLADQVAEAVWQRLPLPVMVAVSERLHHYL